MKWDNNQHRWSPWRLNSGWEMDINADQSVALSTLGQSPCCFAVKRWDRCCFLIGAVWCSSIWRINILHQYQTEKGNTMLFHCASLIFTELKCLRGLLLLLVGSSSPKGSASENQLIFKKIYLSSLNCKFLPLAFTLNLRTDYIFFPPFFLTSLREKKKNEKSAGPHWTQPWSIPLPFPALFPAPLHSIPGINYFISVRPTEFLLVSVVLGPHPRGESPDECVGLTPSDHPSSESLYIHACFSAASSAHKNLFLPPFAFYTPLWCTKE